MKSRCGDECTEFPGSGETLYALHTTSYEEQPVSDRTFSRFRRRLYDYEIRTGIDLMKEEIESLSEVIAEFMNLRNNIRRMDSMMVASRCKAMSRLEIIYTCVSNMIRLLDKLKRSLVSCAQNQEIA